MPNDDLPYSSIIRMNNVYMNIITSLRQKINDRKRISIMSQLTCNDLKGLCNLKIAVL